jgi:hypothetical protein
LAEELAVGRGDIVGVNVLEAMSVGELEEGGAAAGRLLGASVGVAALFFSVEAVGSGGGGIGVGGSGGGFLLDGGFILSEALLEAVDFGLEPLGKMFLALQEIEELFGRESASLKGFSGFTRVHAVVVSNLCDPPRGIG